MKIVVVYLIEISNINLWIFDSKESEKKESREAENEGKNDLDSDCFVCTSV